MNRSANGTARVAIVATPRSGNSWLRTLLRVRYDLVEVAVHSPADLPSPPPERAVIQLHWDREADFEAWLDEHDVRVVSVARHPLDVLVSMLHFASHEPQTSEWLRADLTRDLVGQGPTGEAFRSFALGPAARLLAITPTWQGRPGTIAASYEALCRDTAAELARLGDELGFEPRASVEASLEAGSFGVFRAMANRHGWQGRPGLWRELLVAELAEAVHAAHPGVFEPLGYRCDPDPGLDRATAERRWEELRVPR